MFTPIGNPDDRDEVSFRQPNPIKNIGEDHIASGPSSWPGPRRDIDIEAMINQVMRQNHANKRAALVAKREAMERMGSKLPSSSVDAHSLT